MKVYSVLLSVAYEGQDLLAVFGSREKAVAYAMQQDWRYGEYGVVESELGQPIDLFSMVEWLEEPKA
jgi:hypothetical protein